MYIMDIEKFEIKIDEYNVAYNTKDRDEFNLLITDNYIRKNSEEIKEGLENKINEIKDIISKKLKEIELVANSKQMAYKGGRQKRMNIEINGKTYTILGNNPNTEIAQLYSDIKEEILKIINKM